MGAQSLKPGWKMVKFGDIAQNVAVRVDPVDARIDIHNARKPIGVATYEITKTLPKALRGNCLSLKRSRHYWRGWTSECTPSFWSGIVEAIAKVVGEAGSGPGNDAELPIGTRHLARGPETDRKPKMKSPTLRSVSGAYLLIFCEKNGRDDWIRTSGPLLPKQVRYQTALHPDASTEPDF